MNKIKILIVDDYPLLRAAWKLLLQAEKDVEIVGTVKNGKEAIELVKIVRPDVILMDINMPVLNGIEATAVINNTMPWIKILALTAYNENILIRKMFKAGASGFLSKFISKEELCIAIRKIYSGERYIETNCFSHLVNQFEVSETAHLSERELEIIKLIVSGFTAREIGEKLFISTKTVEVHKNRIFNKCQVRNIASLTKMVIEKGIIF